MRRLSHVLLVAASILVGCGGDGGVNVTNEPSPLASSPSSPSPVATIADFHTEWCSVMQPYLRVIEDLPTLRRDPAIMRAVRNAVNGLDALKLHLEDADLTSAALSVEALADAVDEQADVLDSRAGEISTDLLIETLDDQAKAMKDVNRAVAPAVVEMGRC